MDLRDLSAHAVYEAGRGPAEVGRKHGLDPDELAVLSSNENPLGPSPAAVEAVHEYAGGVNRYPKAAHADLRDALGREWGLEREQVWLAPGGDGALDYLHRALLDPGDAVLVPEPGFAYYAMSARYHHGSARTYPLAKADGFAQRPDAILDAYAGERAVFLISPHSPTGSEISVPDVREVAERTDETTLVVVDEAYAEFAAGKSKAVLLEEREDVAVLRTFSKAYGLAGLRLGYLLAPAAWADAYARVNTPFAVNELACRAGLAALGDDEHVEDSVETARWGRRYLHEHLDVPTWESGGNFVLAEAGDATAITDACARRGVLIRDCTSFGLPACVRITCGTREETRRAVEVLGEVV